MSLLQRVRDAGICAPSLMGEERHVGDVKFDATMSHVLDLSSSTSIGLGSDGAQVAVYFQQIMEMCKSIDSIPGDLDAEKKKAALEQRRSVVLAILAATHPTNDALRRIMANGLLTSLKPWLDDILSGSIGSIDLLLHFLSSITNLPVMKSQVRDSGMGKKVGSIEKSKLCAGTANETAIKSRIQAVKSAWNTSVKTLKEDEPSPPSKKRTIDLSSNGIIAKKAKTEDSSKSTFSSLLKKVANSPPIKSKIISKPPSASMSGLSVPSMASNGIKVGGSAPAKAKKASSHRVKWADHFGGGLEHTREIEGNNGEQPKTNDNDAGNASWSDRKKRDRLREKELLLQAKKKKLLDDDDDDIFAPGPSMRATTSWKPPALIAGITKSKVDSQEAVIQLARMASVVAARYTSESQVPSSPGQMSDVETALDMQSSRSSVPTIIPFFVPQEVPAPSPAPAPIALPQLPPAAAPAPFSYAPPPPPQPAAVGATADMVQAMGLPLFLVGSNVQALQTIASNPSLLNTFVDANGMYDQPNLMALVQTLGQSMPNQSSQPHAPPAVPAYGNPYGQPPAHQTYGTTSASVYGNAQAPGYGSNPASVYGPAATMAPPAPTSAYGQPTSHYGPGGAGAAAGAAGRGGYRGDQNSEANLHMAGYGPATTQAEIIATFAPYVHVKEVVMKNGFCFVNTMDPSGAQTAKNALNGALIGGMPVRINLAQRRNRDAIPPPQIAAPPASNIYGNIPAAPPPLPQTNDTSLIAGMHPPASSGFAVPTHQHPPMGGGSAAPMVDPNSVRDDRGNPATKNLFVAGYGPSTTESELRQLFGLHATITGCVLKGNFSFVNTGDRVQAINARQMLMGTMVNGGVLRINFAKETGRLGTSFDLTYNSASGAGGVGAGGGVSGSRSYYGR